MSALSSLPRAPAANELFKLGYTKYLRWSVIVALVLMIVFFLVTPPYEPKPYKLRTDPMEFIYLPPAPIAPPEPIAPPPVPVNIEPVPIGGIDPKDFPPIIDPREPWPILPPSPDLPKERFVPSSTLPKLSYFAPPDYPEIARLARLEGIVVVNARIDVKGRVVAVEIATGAHPLLNRAALAAARDCRFEPARQRAKLVPVWVAIPYAFRLE